MKMKTIRLYIALSVLLIYSISYIIWINLGLSVRVPKEIMLYDLF